MLSAYWQRPLNPPNKKGRSVMKKSIIIILSVFAFVLPGIVGHAFGTQGQRRSTSTGWFLPMMLFSYSIF
jgi:hypothetical protein